MSKCISIGMAALSLMVVASCSSDDKNISVWLAKSEMTRNPNPMTLDFQTKPKWDYSAATELLGFMRVGEKYSEKELIDYARVWADSMVNENGEIRGYKPTTHNIDHLCPGKLLLRLYNATGDERYMKAASSLMQQVETHPRTTEGGLWHKAVYENQMWLDGLYMGAPFIAEYAQMKELDMAEDMVRQYLIVGKHTYDDSTRLYRHAWDEAHKQFWADSVTGRSQHAWGRANGWYMMGMVDALEFIPEGTVGRDSLVDRLRGLAEALLDYRDKKTGMWYQVLDSPDREGNFVESSCSAMFIYAMLKGERLGYLPEKYRDIAEMAFKQFVATFLKEDSSEGTLSVTQCCAVAGLGGKDMRDGSFDYYIHEKMRDNDPKTIGPFLMACAELGY